MKYSTEIYPTLSHTDSTSNEITNQYDIIPTVLEFAEEHQNNIWDSKAQRKRQLKKIKNVFNQFSDFDKRPITAFRPSQLYEFKTYLKTTRNMKGSTANRYASAWNKVFDFYSDEYRCNVTPRVRREKEGRGRPRFYTKDEIERIKEVFSKSKNSWVLDFTTVMLDTGMRRGEVKNIGLSQNEIDDEETYGKVEDFANGKTKAIHLFNTKNGDERIIPLSTGSAEALQRLKWKPSIFWNHNEYYNLWHYARDKISPGDKDFVGHTCRHTVATKLAKAKFNDSNIGKILGHRSAETTKKYIKTDDETLLAMIDSL
jgi:integrase